MSLILYHLGAKVYGYSLNEKKNKINENVFNLNRICKSFVYGDICDYKKLSIFFKKINPDYCIHMAAQSLVIDSYKLPTKTFETNFNGTLNLLEILRLQRDIPTLIVSSDKCYLNDKKKFFIESNSLGGDDPYSASKAACEVLCHSYLKSYNLKISTVRGGNVIGGGDWNANRLIPDIMRSIFLKKKLVIRNHNQIRPFQHILDVNFSYLKILELIINNNKHCSSYNIGPKSSHKVKEVLGFYKNYIKPNIVLKKLRFKEKRAIFLNSKKSRLLGVKNHINFGLSLKLTFEWYKMYFKDRKKIFNFSLQQINNYFQKYE
jgi:CDP-glucose 4,6-dehydratase